jgi:hypothetical protein
VENSVEFFGADNCSTNQRLAKHAKKPLIGCKSHIFHLAVTAYLQESEIIISNLTDVIEGLSNMKNSLTLAQYTNLVPTKVYRKRWSGIHESFRKWCEIKEFVLPNIRNFTEAVQVPARFLLSNGNRNCIDRLVKKLNTLGYVTKQLQANDCTFAEALNWFDSLLSRDKFRNNVALHSYLSPNAAIVLNKPFERAVEKLQLKQFSSITVEEASTITMFKTNVNHEEVDAEENLLLDEVHPPTYQELVERRLEAKLARNEEGKEYRSTLHVLPTSNFLERLFSHVKLFYSDHRRKMSPINLEMSAFLHANADIGMYDERCNLH